MIFQKSSPLKGELTIPGDKSISHRAVMLGSISEGTTRITHFLEGADCLSTIDCFQKMGIEIQHTPKEILIHGKGLHGLSAPASILDVGNSGTTTRLISGILAGQTFTSELTGDASIQKRPMKRIITPLSGMGASIESIHGNDCAPLRIHGKPLTPISYASPVSSAQVKSCILLAGLCMGASIESIHGNDCAPLRIHGKPLTPISYASPVSSAQVKSCILLAGLYAGASIESIHGNDCAPLRIHGKPLTPISYASPVSSAQVKSCILLAGLYAEGKTSVTEPYVSRNHSELMLSAFGAEIDCQGTTASVLGHPKLQGQSIEVPGDISSAAYFIAAGLLIPKSEILIKNVGINPTRDGILRVCRQMGGKVEILNERKEGLEPVADLLVTSSSLHGTVIEKELIPTFWNR